MEGVWRPMVTEGVTLFTQSPSPLAQILKGSGEQRTGQEAAATLLWGSGPATSGLDVARNGQSWEATESGWLPAGRTQPGCPVSGASCPQPAGQGL